MSKGNVARDGRHLLSHVVLAAVAPVPLSPRTANFRESGRAGSVSDRRARRSARPV